MRVPAFDGRATKCNQATQVEMINGHQGEHNLVIGFIPHTKEDGYGCQKTIILNITAGALQSSNLKPTTLSHL